MGVDKVHFTGRAKRAKEIFEILPLNRNLISISDDKESESNSTHQTKSVYQMFEKVLGMVPALAETPWARAHCNVLPPPQRSHFYDLFSCVFPNTIDLACNLILFVV